MSTETNIVEPQADDRVPVTVVVTRHVPPGREPDFEVWQEKMIDAVSRLEGHLGVSVIRPSDKKNPEYVTIFKFDHYSNLKKWLQSEVRLKLIEESKRFAPEDPKLQILTGLESWFTLPGQPMAPEKYKMVVLTTIAIFVLVNVLGYLSEPFVAGLSGLARSAVLTPITCAIMTYWAMPSMTRVFAKWLYP
jgi:antibiotic biosynthesis monooxygenase (ABM) superfamily enzyme